MLIRTTLIAFCLSFILGGCTDSQEYADAIYFGGDILTMQGDTADYVEAITIKDGKIQFMGDKDQALKYQQADTGLHNLNGNTLMPSFIDAHGHFMSAMEMVQQVNLALPPVGTVKDIGDIIAQLKAYQSQRKLPKGEWILGWGYDENGLSEQRHITKLDLDPHFPDHKVMIIHVSQHGAVLNSMALDWAGINAQTATPKGGVINRLPRSNEPAGLLMEMAYLPVYLKRPIPTEQEMFDGILDQAQQMYASEGYTHAQDGFSKTTNIDFLQRAAQQDKLYLDVVSLPGFIETEQWMNNEKYPFGEYVNGLKLQGMKITQDGSPQAKTAFISAPYLTGGLHGEADWHGTTTQPKDSFVTQVKQAVDAGLQVFIHANGDATIDQAIEAIEMAGIKAKDDRRSVIIHSQFQRPDQLDKYAQLGISPSYFSNHTFFWGDVHSKNIGVEKASFISPIKAAVNKGLVYSNHTDFNVTPLDPFFVLWTAMKRETRSGKILGGDQTVDIYTALQGLTTGPAWQIFEENRKGKLQTGLLADLVILNKNPITTGVDNIKDIEVLTTIKQGKVIFQRPNSQKLSATH